MNFIWSLTVEVSNAWSLWRHWYIHEYQWSLGGLLLDLLVQLDGRVHLHHCVRLQDWWSTRLRISRECVLVASTLLWRRFIFGVLASHHAASSRTLQHNLRLSKKNNQSQWINTFPFFLNFKKSINLELNLCVSYFFNQIYYERNNKRRRVRQVWSQTSYSLIYP